MGAVFTREIRYLLRNLRAIICIGVLVFASGIIFTVNNVNLAYPSIEAIIATLSLVFALAIPVIAGFSISGERKKGTDGQLAVLPISKKDIVFGKLLALMVIFAIPTAIVCLYPIILGFFGTVSYSYSYSAILFLAIFELTVISFSMMISAILPSVSEAASVL